VISIRVASLAEEKPDVRVESTIIETNLLLDESQTFQ
jgi:hypothetical protein